jgi:hypothetical protein
MAHTAQSIPDEIKHEDFVKGMFADVTADDIKKTDTHLSSYFNRHYNSQTGVEAVTWLLNERVCFLSSLLLPPSSSLRLLLLVGRKETPASSNGRFCCRTPYDFEHAGD